MSISNRPTPWPPGSELDEDQVLKLYEELLEQRFIRKPKPKKLEPEAAMAVENEWKRKYGRDVDRFLSPGGLEVLAGRSAHANERVSFELTLKDGLWRLGGRPF